jgi:hypothetical protein
MCLVLGAGVNLTLGVWVYIYFVLFLHFYPGMHVWLGGAGIVAYPWVAESGGPVAVEPVAGFGTRGPVLDALLKTLPHEVRDADIERDKAGHRGLFLAEFRKILADCDAGDPDDPRWHELRLRTLDRMAKLLRVYEPDLPAAKQGPGNPKDLANAAAAALVELEASLAETRAG